MNESRTAPPLPIAHLLDVIERGLVYPPMYWPPPGPVDQALKAVAALREELLNR